MQIIKLSTRRRVLQGLTATSVALMTPGLGVALTNEEASALIGRLVSDINVIINSGKTETAMYSEFERVFKKYGDTPIIARSALGVAWRSASAGQKKAFIKAFEGYIGRKYGKRFREFIGGKIEVTGAKKVKTGYLVTSLAYLQGMAPFIIEWQVSDKSGADKMFNLYIEGINMLATERTEIGAMLDKRRGNLNKLIADLKTQG